MAAPPRSTFIALAKANLQLEGVGALYERLAQALKRAIAAGHFPGGNRLPASRDLARILCISRNTVVAAYDLLSAERIVISRGGSGTRVAAHHGPRPVQALPSPIEAPSRYVLRTRRLGPTTLAAVTPAARYDLHYGEPLMNRRLFNSWRRKLTAATLRTRSGYPPVAGFMPLRRAICDYLGKRRSIICSPQDLIIVNGTQQALTIVARTVLDEGDTAVIEDPHYQMAMHSLLAHGANIVSARTDQDGIVVSEIAVKAVRLIHVTPSHQFPSGVTLSLERRLELLKLAVRTQSWIFEDDYDSEFHFDGKPLPTLYSLDASNRVIYAGSFSKTVFPALRLGYIVCPPQLRDDLYKTKMLDDLGCPAIEQAALAAYLQCGQADKHLLYAVRELRKRRQELLRALTDRLRDEIEVSPSRGGMHVVVWFKRIDYDQFAALLRLSAARGLGLHPIAPYYRLRPARPGMLIGFGGLTSLQLKVAIELLGQCLGETLRRP